MMMVSMGKGGQGAQRTLSQKTANAALATKKATEIATKAVSLIGNPPGWRADPAALRVNETSWRQR
jgi:hypothetical protein